MKRIKVVLPIIALSLILTGCYHAKVTTGNSPSGQVIEEPFAMSWVYGLIPPPTVEAGDQCTNGVAVVETQISFVNGLVRSLTGGIFTPMSIKVTCAAGGMGSVEMPDGVNKNMTIPRNATEREISGAFMNAADRAVQTDEPVYVQFE